MEKGEQELHTKWISWYRLHHINSHHPVVVGVSCGEVQFAFEHRVSTILALEALAQKGNISRKLEVNLTSKRGPSRFRINRVRCCHDIRIINNRGLGRTRVCKRHQQSENISNN